jgi:condensation domain-containing protein
MTEMSDAAAREELLRRRLLGGAAPPPRIGRDPRQARPALSFAQERIWFIDQLYPGTTAYAIPVMHRLRGHLDIRCLERALAAVVERHESLRTRFAVHGGQPYQVIDTPRFNLPVRDLTTDPRVISGEVQPDALARARIGAAAAMPFDLADGPLLRACLFRLGPDDHVLFLCVHHSVFDGWSLGVLRREVSACYGALRRGDTPELPDLPVQYADYAAWQRRELTSGRLADDLSYWRMRLAGAPLVLELPTDRPRPPQPSYRAGRVTFQLPAQLARSLRALAHQHKASLFMLTLSAYQALLSRHAGTTDLIVGSSVSGRGRTEFEPMIGFFVNSLALRCSLAGDPPFASLLRRTREQTLDDFAHQDLPLEYLVREIAPTRDLSRNPVTQVWFNVQNLKDEISELRLDGVDASDFKAADITTRFDLELHLTDGGDDSLVGGLIYASDLFEHRSMELFAEHYVRFLAEIARDPAQRVSRVPIMTAEELALLARWNNEQSTADSR